MLAHKRLPLRVDAYKSTLQTALDRKIRWLSCHTQKAQREFPFVSGQLAAVKLQLRTRRTHKPSLVCSPDSSHRCLPGEPCH